MFVGKKSGRHIFAVLFCLAMAAWPVDRAFAGGFSENVRDYDISEIYPVSADGEIMLPPDFTVDFMQRDWNLLSVGGNQPSGGLTTGKQRRVALAGWRINNDDLPLDFSPGEEFLFRVQSRIEDLSYRMRQDGEISRDGTVSENGSSSYIYASDPHEGGGLYVGKLKRKIKSGATLSAGLLKTDALNEEDACDLAGLPSRAAKLGVTADMGGVRVWGEFQINDWNGINENSPSSSSRAVAGQSTAIVGRSALSLAGSDNGEDAGSPIDSLSIEETVSYEFGASFPSERSVGSLHYRRSLDDGTAKASIAREQVGIQGELALLHNVRLKAGFEKISTSGLFKQQEHNVWTGIEIHF